MSSNGGLRALLNIASNALFTALALVGVVLLLKVEWALFNATLEQMPVTDEVKYQSGRTFNNQSFLTLLAIVASLAYLYGAWMLGAASRMVFARFAGTGLLWWLAASCYVLVFLASLSLHLDDGAGHLGLYYGEPEANWSLKATAAAPISLLPYCGPAAVVFVGLILAHTRSVGWVGRALLSYFTAIRENAADVAACLLLVPLGVAAFGLVVSFNRWGAVAALTVLASLCVAAHLYVFLLVAIRSMWSEVRELSDLLSQMVG
jgi:hypothetical protein